MLGSTIINNSAAQQNFLKNNAHHVEERDIGFEN